MTAHVVGVLAEALAQHQLRYDARGCKAGRTCGAAVFHKDHAEHVASVVAALPNIAIVELPEPEPDETVHPYWAVEDVSGLQVVRTTDSDGSAEGDWVNIEFTARWRTVDRETAQALGVAFLAAARAAGGQA